MKNEIWRDATWFHKSTRLDTPYSKSRIFKGIKIENTDGDIKILNTKLNGDFYQEVSKEEYRMFYRLGFEQGCYEMCLANYRMSLNTIIRNIRDEIGSRNNQKHYQYLKTMRVNLMEKYTNVLKIKYNGSI